MRQFVFYAFSFLSIFSLSSYSFASIVTYKTSEQAFKYEVQINDVDIETQTVRLIDTNFIKITLKGFEDNQGILYKEGYPQLPTIYFYIEGEIEDIKFSQLQKINPNKIFNMLPFQYKIMPSQPSLEKKYSYLQSLHINNNIYNSNELYPNKPYEIKNVGYKNSTPIKLLILYPISYIPRQNEIFIRNNFSFSVKQYISAIKSNLYNIPKVTLFVVGKQFQNSPSLINYAQYYEMFGYQVQYLYIEPYSDPKNIRTRIQQIYKDPNIKLKNVLIIGDIKDVPSYYTDLMYDGVTDHYYASLDNEYKKDIATPDVGLGRIAVKNEEELSTVLNKNIKYLLGNFKDQSWLEYISFIATDDEYKIAEGSHNYAISNYTSSLGFQGTFPQSLQEGGDQLYAITHSATSDDVISRMNEGRMIINYSGHGMETYWAGPKITQNDVKSLSHPDALPFVISNACLTGHFITDESFAETWLKHKNGSIIFWGSMKSTYWDEDDVLEKRMYDGIFKHNLSNFSDITNFALSELWAYYGGENKSAYYWETYHIFGDPFLHLRTQKIQYLDIDFPQVVSTASTQIDIFVYKSYKPLPNAIVNLFNHEEQIWLYSTTDEKGMVTFDISYIKRPLRLKMVIFDANSVPYINTIYVK